MNAFSCSSSAILLSQVKWYEFGPEGSSIFTLDEVGQLSRWEDGHFQTEQRLLNVGKQFNGAASSKDGRWLATGSTNGTFELWDLPQAKSMGRVGNYPGEFSPREFSSDGTRLIVLDEANELFCEWDLQAFQQIRTFRPIEQPFRSSFSHDLQWYLSATFMGNFSLEESRTGRTVRGSWTPTM